MVKSDQAITQTRVGVECHLIAWCSHCCCTHLLICRSGLYIQNIVGIVQQFCSKCRGSICLRTGDRASRQAVTSSAARGCAAALKPPAAMCWSPLPLPAADTHPIIVQLAHAQCTSLACGQSNGCDSHLEGLEGCSQHHGCWREPCGMLPAEGAAARIVSDPLEVPAP